MVKITVGNQENMDIRGFNLSGGMTAAAEGSFELATKLREYTKGMSFHVKFCEFQRCWSIKSKVRRRADCAPSIRDNWLDDTILFGAIPTVKMPETMIDLSNHLDLSEVG